MKNTIKHGAYSKKAIDRRTRAGRMLSRLETDLMADLGGIEYLSTQEKILVKEVVGKVRQSQGFSVWYSVAMQNFVEQIECLNGDSLKGTDKETLALLVQLGELLQANRQYWLAFSNSLRLDLQTLGIKKRVKDITDLSSYLKAQKEGAPLK